MAEKCKECGCICGRCVENGDENHADVHLHVEIENLRQRLFERDSHIVTMETQFLNEADKFPNGELASMKDEMLAWQDKYSRLYEAHKRVQKVNQNLEDKLLRIVDKCETEKSAFTKDIATLSHRLADANYTIHRLTQDNEKYRNDVNLAIQLLQCKPSNFVSQRYDSLPSEVQAKVRTYVAQKRVSNDAAASVSDVKSITVPISTFPPTAMVYNVTKTNNVDKDSDEESDDSKPPVDIVSAAIMAKVLEERERERVFAKHCDTCTCHRSILTNDAETQTEYGRDDGASDCDKNLNNFVGDRDYVNKSNNSLTNNSTISKQQQRNQPFEVEYVNEKSSSQTQKIASKKKLDNFLNRTNDKDDTTSRTKSIRNNYSRNGNDIDACNGDTCKKKITSSPSKEEEEEKVEGEKSGTFTARSNKLVILSSDKLSLNTVERSKEDKSLTSGRQTGGGRIGFKKADQQQQNVYKSSKLSNNSEWKKYEQLPCQDVDLIDLKENSSTIFERRMKDAINKRNRIWNNDDKTSMIKRGLTRNKKPDGYDDEADGGGGDNTFDLINERRVWKTNVDVRRSDNNLLASSGKELLTLIEVKPLICDEVNPATNVVNSESEDRQHHHRHHRNRENGSSSSIRLRKCEDTAASPSFSSDSLVISSSDPPSTSSEFGNNRITLNKMSAVDSVNDDNNINNNNSDNIRNNNNNNNINSNNNNNNNNNENEKQNEKNKNSLMSNWQDRTTGPRGCSMRITPGSKNILLDNAGHYQTILYTSGGNGNGKASTALVHNVAKSSKSGGSASTSSEDNNSPVLPVGNTQLQRVAEWIKASGPLERDTGVKSLDSLKVGGRKSSDDMSVKTLNKALIKIKDNKSQQQQQQQQQQQLIMNDEIAVTCEDFDDENKGISLDKKMNSNTSIYETDNDEVKIDIGENCVSGFYGEKIYSHVNRSDRSIVDTVKGNSDNGDLISFESSNDDGEDYSLQYSSSMSNNICRNYKTKDDSRRRGEGVAGNGSSSGGRFRANESSSSVSGKIIDVKITKEMEETYLKLAASLDPANLELSSSESADITIEKYRKKWKRNNGQKIIDDDDTTARNAQRSTS